MKIKVIAAMALLGLVGLLLYVPGLRADRAYTLCDPAKSTLCSGLVVLYEFDETTSDTRRTSETASPPLMEIGRVDTA